jgi:hypothetical protein
MNSLYGKFGMNPYLPQQLVINQEELSIIENDPSTIVVDIIPINGDKLIISIINDDINPSSKVNVAIAAAITA